MTPEAKSCDIMCFASVSDVIVASIADALAEIALKDS
jgi:hypothetical protein